MEILPDHILAEGINGGNRCIGQQDQLALQAAGFRRFFQLRLQCGLNAFAHFCRSRLGKGHDQEPVHIEIS